MRPMSSNMKFTLGNLPSQTLGCMITALLEQHIRLKTSGDNVISLIDNDIYTAYFLLNILFLSISYVEDTEIVRKIMHRLLRMSILLSQQDYPLKLQDTCFLS